jgi:hypothetical protein
LERHRGRRGVAPSSESARPRWRWPGVSPTLIGARTVEQLRANLASLEVALTPAELAALEEPSAPSLDFPAITAGRGPVLSFDGTTIDGVELPVWPLLEASPTRY